MEIKDLAGLSEPITRLIEVVAIGVGKVTTPYLIKKTAKARAYEIKVISQALREVGADVNKIEYQKDDIRILSSGNGSSDEITILERADSRVLYKEAKRQANLEDIVSHAADELTGEELVTGERPEEDWITRFFNIAQDISSEKMKVLWGKILSGEIKKPNSYSLRTLEILRNISTKEAEIFSRVGSLALTYNKESFLYNNQEFLQRKFGVSFKDILLLEDLGLLLSKDVEIRFNPDNKGGDKYLISGNSLLLIRNPCNVSRVTLPVNAFSMSGNEMLTLIERDENIQYLKRVADHIGSDKRVSITIADIISFEEEGVRYNNERKLA